MPKEGQDPAFLFYYQDFAFGTRFFDRRTKGGYIDLMIEQAARFSSNKDYKMSIEEIKSVLGKDFDLWEILKCKYEEEDGKYWNDTLLKRQSERKNFTDSRKANKLSDSYDKDMMNICSKYVRHMEDEIEDENEIKKIVNAFKILEEIPDFEKSWYEWYCYRKSAKKKILPSTMLKQIKFLSLQMNPIDCINQSIKNGWQGLFEIKGAYKQEQPKVPEPKMSKELLELKRIDRERNGH